MENPHANVSGMGSSSTELESQRHRKASVTYRRRQRAAQACETCHTRKVRCDVSTLGMPCTNCAAFRVECKIPQRNVIFSASANPSMNMNPLQLENTESLEVAAHGDSRTPTGLHHMSEQSPMPALTKEQAQDQDIAANMFIDLMKKTEFTKPALAEAGQVTFLGESMGIDWIVKEHDHPLHFPMVAGFGELAAGVKRLDNLEMDILHQRSAFRLPPKDIRDDLVVSFFQWIHPIVPAINKTEFLQQYNDPTKSPSLFLLQTVMLAGSRVSRHPKVAGNVDSHRKLSQTFYERAKALYNVGFETDRVKMIQGLILMSWYSQDPDAVTDNAFFWISAAISVAEGAGMHRSIERSNLTRSQKRTWRRIWWVLYTRDREVAITLGRPVVIDLSECDVELATEDDFIESEEVFPEAKLEAPGQVRFFLDFVRLCNIMTIILNQQYSRGRHRPRNAALDLIQTDMALGEWLEDCQLLWERSKHNPWTALLTLHYHTAVCLLQRAYLPPPNAANSGTGPAPAHSLSRNMAYRSADAITEIVDVLQAEGQLLSCPPFLQYALLSALSMHSRRVHEPDPMNYVDVREQIKICINALQELSKGAQLDNRIRTWLDADSESSSSRPTMPTGASRHAKKRSQSFHQTRHQSAPSTGHSRSMSFSKSSTKSSERASGPQMVKPNALYRNSSQPSPVPGVPTEMLSVFECSSEHAELPPQNTISEMRRNDTQHTSNDQVQLLYDHQSYEMAVMTHQAAMLDYQPQEPMTWDNQQIYESTLDGGNVLHPGGFEGNRSNTVGFMGSTSGLPGSFTDISMEDWFRYFGVREEEP